MFFFRCCMRVDCGCQSEPEAEVSRSSTSDYSQRSEKQIQRRLLPQPVVSSCTKHFTDYSGCSQTTASHALLVDSTHSADYEEVLCISVPSRTENDELTYSQVDDNVICKPPRSIGIVNNNFSPDASSSNNNVLQPETDDNEKLLQDTGRQNESESDENSDVSSASSNIDDHTSAEVKYVADIRQFRPTQTSIRPHGDDCCCVTCQSDEGFDRTEDDAMIHHSSDVKCLCKSCRDFDCRMQCIYTTADFSTTAGSSMFSKQNAEDISLTWSQSAKTSDVYIISEYPTFSYQDNVQPRSKNSVLANHSESVSRVSESEGVDNDDGLFSGDDELHYVFHKFIGDSYLSEPFTDVLLSTDDSLRVDAVVQSESGAQLECTSARSADDLEVAFFMVGNISPSKSCATCPDGAFVASSILSAADTSAYQHEQTALLTETAAPSTAELTAHSFDTVTEPSSYHNHESLSTVENDSKPCSLNVVCEDVEPDTFAGIYDINALNISSGSLSELENMSDVLESELRGLETDVYVNSSFSVLSHESQELDSDNMRRDVIVQKLGDNSSLFIELPALADEHVADDNDDNDEYDGSTSISPSAHMDGSCTTQELAPAEEEAFIEQRVEIVTPECITEHPVLIDKVNSPQTADNVSNGHSTAASIASYVCDVVADAAWQIADDASAGLCSVQDEDISSKWPQQILITNAPLLSSKLLQTTEDEYDRHFHDLYIPKIAEGDTERQFTIGGLEHGNVGTDTVGVLDDDVDISPGNEAMCMTDIQSQEVPQVENYLISYDLHLLQQPVDDDVDSSIDGMPIWSSHSTCRYEIDTGLYDLVQPLEHVVSENEQDILVASELNLDLGEDLTDHQGADKATFAVTDIVEDFFMQYVLPVDSMGYGTKMDTAAAVDVPEEQFGDVAHISEVDQEEEDLVLAKELENTAQNILDVVISDAIAEVNTPTSAVVEVQYQDQHDTDCGLEHLVHKTELESTAETIVDVVVSDAVAESEVDMSDDNFLTGPTLSPVAASSDTLSVSPTRSTCLHSPSESLHKKSVHFADMHGLQLETVQHYDQALEPEEHRSSLEEFLSKLSAAAAERRAKWTEHHTSPVGSWLCSSSVYLLACFELPGSQEELLERVHRCHVALESCSFDDLALAISGVVRVANVAFNKKILVRYSIDHWITQTDIDGEYIARSNDGPTDRFSFAIILPSGKQFVIGSEVEFAICYIAGDFPSFKFWDNNHGRNYVVRYCSKTAGSNAKNVNLSTDDGNRDNDDGD